ncbi:HIT hydrolase [gamma proteobacterium BDW918]|uniref:Diadenosine tetraphosphate hydrolase n=1 Tax=Zhongshania aliphaticivorans TaxID=1470434 RepID=A0A127M3R4_9GAMM|nr:HIT domain-containing protein [Zhongshania aliphaticivorans]AMO67801.1 diadenosine tetraphosphate hydrolase [Zhongshania aliphaticivorans]EIF44829.1 HIT hydrolase [gamma proteobacterium BDW918]
MFELHEALARDCAFVGDLALCRLLLMNDKQYPWLILVPRRAEMREICDLSGDDQLQYLQESNLCSAVLRSEFGAEKLNIAALGNMVPQLHIHHIARFSSDPAWPKPVWGQLPAKPYSTDELQGVVAQLRQVIQGRSALDF